MNAISKAVFRPEEVALSSIKVVLDPPHVFPELAHLAPLEEEPEEIVAAEEYLGPTADDLRREAESFKIRWEEEKDRMIRTAQSQADDILQEARETAARETEGGAQAIERLRQEAEAEAERLLEETRNKAAGLEADAQTVFENTRKEAEEQGREQGKEAGYAEGKAEVGRLVERVRTVLERAQDKRAEILSETEQQIIDLVLLISRKVVKVISENQRDVVVSNVIQALRKVKGQGNIIIRVNLKDLELATEHTADFIQTVEGTSSLQIAEDSSVDPGGCIIETDFGEIDARIASQLAELEARILEASPIKNRAKSAGPGAAKNNGV